MSHKPLESFLFSSCGSFYHFWWIFVWDFIHLRTITKFLVRKGIYLVLFVGFFNVFECNFYQGLNLIMSAKTLRRRLHHGDVDGRREENFDTSGYDSLNEPLLGSHEHDDMPAGVRVSSCFFFFFLLEMW